VSDTQPNAAGPDVLVIGAGVAGLTTAICVAEAGLRVEVRATLPPARTTSAVAGAIWGLHLVTVDDRVSRWGRETLARLTGLAGQGPLADPSDAAAAPPIR
jgi:D-amino-acid oxidase